MMRLHVSSPAFQNGGIIPKKYTADGEDINPPLEIQGIPKEAKSLVLIVDDPDAPRGTWVHWIVWNIPVVELIRENNIPGVQGVNDFMQHNYGGPSPPSGTHRYFFKVYALDKKLDLPPTSRKRDLEAAMHGHILAMGELVGLYTRK